MHILYSAADAAANTEATGGGLFGNFGFLAIMAVALIAMYFLMLRPNRKKEKEAAELRNSLEVGDEITTIGGIVGRVVSIKEDTVVIETAGERSRIRFLRGAIDKVNKLNLDGSNADAGKDKTKEKTKGEK